MYKIFHDTIFHAVLFITCCFFNINLIVATMQQFIVICYMCPLLLQYTCPGVNIELKIKIGTMMPLSYNFLQTSTQRQVYQ